MRNDILYRVRTVIRATTSERRRLKELEEETGIASTNWKNVWTGRQRPTAHMIEALARRWPQYAFWIATGLTDTDNGHTAPTGAWTAGQPRTNKAAEATAVRYFEFQILAQDSVYGTNGALESDFGDLKATEKQKVNDLEHAIAHIAYERRKSALQAKFPDFDADAPFQFKSYSAITDELNSERRYVRDEPEKPNTP
ncbi:hypothetical protein NLI96_g13243 [Meripilus lineatus]|uniref:Uncharacterized protein n=1 Tax=Meripilus lineatus TaxID=2056292 RepID=A0AAD5UNE6_9APHY|nr:hypothetical protein NLI96_g13243 [Physisporinus lineatus]